MKPLTQADLNRALLARQMLLARENISPLKAIERLAGMQAQQARPPFVGLWTRLEHFQRAELLKLFHRRRVVRATGMRATTEAQRKKLRKRMGEVAAVEWGEQKYLQKHVMEIAVRISQELYHDDELGR